MPVEGYVYETRHEKNNTHMHHFLAGSIPLQVHFNVMTVIRK
jgi:hypothetical protein